jgi:hypothetical protein
MLAAAITGGGGSSTGIAPTGVTSSVCGGAAVVQVAGRPTVLSGEQIPNAQAIAGVALSLGLGRPGVLVGILTANIESDLHNLAGGDRDSVGLFQQRNPWGSVADRMDPVKSATMFFTGGQGGQPGLLDFPGWEAMDPGVAMQRVQQSQFSGGSSPGYAGKLATATAATDALMAGQPAAVTVPAAAPCSMTAPPKLPGTGGTHFSGVMNNSQDPSSYGWKIGGPTVPLVFQGRSFGRVAAGTQGLWVAMLAELAPLIPGGLNSNVGCLDVRRNVNSPSKWSLHAYGIACDLNSDVNCNGCSAQSVQGKRFALPMATREIVAKYGFRWGGDFRGTPDPMHIELGISPQQIN